MDTGMGIRVRVDSSLGLFDDFLDCLGLFDFLLDALGKSGKSRVLLLLESI